MNNKKLLIPSFEFSEKSIHEVMEEARQKGLVILMTDFCQRPWKYEKELEEKLYRSLNDESVSKNQSG